MLAAWLVLTLPTLGVLPADALECPAAQSTSQHGVLQETRHTIALRAHTLKAIGSAAIPGMIYNLRIKYPGSTNSEITNYLITAYCPVVNQKSGVSNEQKRALLARFADQVRARLD